MSDSLRPRGLQHARPPCPSPAPGVHWNSCPLSRWCHPTISSSVALNSFSSLQTTMKHCDIPFSYKNLTFNSLVKIQGDLLAVPMTAGMCSLIFIQVLALTWSRSRQKCRMCYKDKGEVSGTAGQETQLCLTRAQTRREKTSGNNSHFLSLLFFTSAFCFSPLLKAEATPQPEFISSELWQPTMTA